MLTPSLMSKIPFGERRGLGGIRCAGMLRTCPAGEGAQPMRRAKSWPIEELRQAIDCLPARTRVAMLDGVHSNSIIAGAYTDRSGGVCPMLAAHRCGGRTDLLAFAHAWD